MAVPQSVLDAEAEADRLIAEMAKAKPEGAVESTEPEAAAEEEVEERKETPAEEAAEEAAEGKHEEDAGDDGGELAQVKAELVKLQARYDTLRGKTYAEVPRVLSENKILKDKIAELESKVAELGSRDGAGAAAGNAALAGKAGDILASLKEDVSDSVADRIQQLVEAIVEERVATRIGSVESTVNSIRSAEESDRQTRYLERLTELVPDWRVIVAKPDYAEFLTKPDELSGKTLFDLATDALNTLDADRMALFFRQYKKEKGVATEGTAKKTGKEALMAPKGATRTSGKEVGSGDKPDYITTKQLEEFNKKRRTMSAEEEAKWEARIDRAIQKGWIVPV